MRVFSTLLGVLGGLVGVAFAYAAFLLSLMGAGAEGNKRYLLLWFVLVILAASIFSFVGGVMNPRKAVARWLLALSGSVWIVCGLLAVFLRPQDGANPISLAQALEAAGTIMLPGLLPLASFAVATWLARTPAPA